MITHTGGAIDSARTRDIEPPEPKQAVRPARVAFMDRNTRVTPLMPRVLHGIAPYKVEPGQPYFMLRDPVYSEDFLLTDLRKLAKPGGLSSHHPEVRQVVFDTLKKYPELLEHYMRR